MRRRLAAFQRPEIRSATSESVGDSRQLCASVERRRSLAQRKIEVLGFVDLLHTGAVLRIEPRHLDEDVVIDQHAVLILLRCGAVLSECGETARLDRAVRHRRPAAPNWCGTAPGSRGCISAASGSGGSASSASLATTSE